jgi:hypothetical protein
MNMEGKFLFKGLKIYNDYGMLNESIQYTIIRVEYAYIVHDRFRCYKYSEEQILLNYSYISLGTGFHYQFHLSLEDIVPFWVVYEKRKLSSPIYPAGWCSGNTLGLYIGGAHFESRSGHQLSR